MTEQEWVECTNPERMLQFLRGKASGRKLRLFACACAWRIWHHITDRYSRRAIKIAEKFADGLVDETKLKLAWGDACRSAVQEERRNRGQLNYSFVASNPAEEDAWMAALRQVHGSAAQQANRVALPEQNRDVWAAAYQAERDVQCALLRDAIGNPFRPVVLAHSCRTSQALALAQAIYEDRCFDDMPVLADALEEAGCTNRHILNHCREPEPHARGCWAVDLLLGLE